MAHKNGKRPKPAAVKPTRPRKSRATPGLSPDIKRIPQPHGGALLATGIPGNGGGRPPSVVRLRARVGFYDRIPILEAIADGASESSSDRIRAVLGLGAIGMSGSVTVDDVRERLRLTLEIIRRELAPEDAVRVLAAIRHVWQGEG